ncbi:site-specific integrase [Nonomuraea rosea]|uniref:site-specific integrase n=1 Tax=Nonomuraea rosea TaxID=638574 RepID=UPI0031EA52D0
MEVGTVDPVIAEQLGRSHPLAAHLDDFLTDLANAGKSAHTRRAYRGDLLAFAAHHGEEIGELTAAPVRAFLAEFAELSPASRKRKRAAVASFAKSARPFHQPSDCDSSVVDVVTGRPLRPGPGEAMSQQPGEGVDRLVIAE